MFGHLEGGPAVPQLHETGQQILPYVSQQFQYQNHQPLLPYNSTPFFAPCQYPNLPLSPNQTPQQIEKASREFGEQAYESSIQAILKNFEAQKEKAVHDTLVQERNKMKFFYQLVLTKIEASNLTQAQAARIIGELRQFAEAAEKDFQAKFYNENQLRQYAEKAAQELKVQCDAKDQQLRNVETAARDLKAQLAQEHELRVKAEQDALKMATLRKHELRNADESIKKNQVESDDLRIKWREVFGENHQMRESVEIANRDLQKYKTQMECALKTANKERELRQAAQREIDELKKKLASLQATANEEIEAATSELTICKVEITQLVEKNAQLQNSIEELNEQVQKLDRVSAELEQERSRNDKLQQRIGELTRAFEICNETLRDVQWNRAYLERYADMLLEVLNDSREKMEENEVRMVEMKREEKLWREEKKNIKEEKILQDSKIANFEEKLSIQEMESVDIKQDVMNRDSEIAKLKKEKKSLVEEKMGKENQIGELNEELNILKREREQEKAEWTQEKKEMEAKKKVLELEQALMNEKMEDKVKELDAMVNRIQELENGQSSALAACIQDKQRMENELKEQKSSHIALEALWAQEKRQLESELKEKKDELEELEKEKEQEYNERFAEGIVQLENEQSFSEFEWKTEKTDFVEQNTNQIKVTMMQSDMEPVEDSYGALDEEEEENVNLRSENEKLARKIDRLEKREKNFKENNGKLKKKLSDQKAMSKNAMSSLKKKNKAFSRRIMLLVSSNKSDESWKNEALEEILKRKEEGEQYREMVEKRVSNMESEFKKEKKEMKKESKESELQMKSEYEQKMAEMKKKNDKDTAEIKKESAAKITDLNNRNYQLYQDFELLKRVLKKVTGKNWDPESRKRKAAEQLENNAKRSMKKQPPQEIDDYFKTLS